MNTNGNDSELEVLLEKKKAELLAEMDQDKTSDQGSVFSFSTMADFSQTKSFNLFLESYPVLMLVCCWQFFL